MNLLQRIGNSIVAAEHALEPWLKSFLTSIVHAEVDTATQAATAYVEQALPALASAAATGDWNTFADTQASVVKSTAQALEQSATKVAVTSVTTAVNALIVGHPAIIAASNPPQGS